MEGKKVKHGENFMLGDKEYTNMSGKDIYVGDRVIEKLYDTYMCPICGSCNFQKADSSAEYVEFECMGCKWILRYEERSDETT